jgi:hypothetical protein
MLHDEKVELLAPPPSEYNMKIVHAMCAIAQTKEICSFILLLQVIEKVCRCKQSLGEELLAALTQANRASGCY